MLAHGCGSKHTQIVVNGAQRDYRHNTGGIGHSWEVLDGNMVWWFSANNYFYINVHGEADCAYLCCSIASARASMR